MDIYQELALYCNFDSIELVTKLLKDTPNLDLTEYKGRCFGCALVNGNAKMLKLLLKYYKDTCLQGGYDSISYKYAKYKLRKVLQEEYDTYNPNMSEKLEKILFEYLPQEYDSDSSQDLGDDEPDICVNVDKYSDS